MPYEKQKSKVFSFPFEAVYKAAYVSVQALGGKILKNEPDKKLLHAQMDKRIRGETLGDRSKFEMSFEEDDSGNTTLSILAYPLDAVGRKLMFGARKGVVDQALIFFFDEMDQHLS